MKDNIISIFLSILIFLVIVIFTTISLDLCGVISLPEKYSIKTYLSDTIQVTAFDDNSDIYYPDYNATGIGTLENTAKEEDNIDISNIIDTTEGNTTTTSVSNNITDNSYYYNQLDVYGKTIYSKLYSNLDDLKSGNYTVDFGSTFNELLQNSDGNQILTDAFQLSINALLLDHPEIFYLDVTKMYMFTESSKKITGTTYKISIGPDSGVGYLAEGFNSKSDVLTAENKLETELNLIKSKIRGNVYDQIKQVHDILIDKINYDSNSSSDLSHGVYGALVNNLAVCDGYAKAFKYILDNLGISCVEICGVGQNSSGTVENHAWNDVLINGTWYAVDVTWDDPIIVGGNGGSLTNDLRYNYFLKGADTFYSSHQEDGYIVTNGTFYYPTISSVAYQR